MARPTREARIDLDALKSNIRVLRNVVSPAQTMVVVKADAYGHGAIEIGRAAADAGADWLGVVDIAEALALRAAGLGLPILSWLHGDSADFSAAVDARVDLGISTLAQLDQAATAVGHSIVQLKVDTGLSRNGIEQSLAGELFRRAAEYEREGRLSVRGVWSHLANAGADEDAEQLRRFDAAVAQAEEVGLRPELRHLAATAGALSFPESRLDLVRLGIGVYGLSPFDGTTSADLGLRPVMELSAEIVNVKRVPAGSGVSYGYTYRTVADTTLALVPLGYADGIPRSASSAGPVSINGRTFSISGRVAMDQFVVDVGDLDVKIGDRAVLFGDPTTGVPSAEDWASAAATINYEIVTRIGARVPRVYVP
jgi:alanine racemase